MAPKQKPANKQKAQEEQREETLQAVILCDSFEDRFAPFALEKPRSLLPVANIPLLEYTLEFVANCGIKHVFLYSGAHHEQIEDHIYNSRWLFSTSPFSSLTVLRSPATSTGDFLRDLDKRDLITGDFIVISGDVISNVDLNSAINQHRARREKDKNAIMTMVLRETGMSYRSKPSSRKPVFFIDPSKKRCLHYEEVSSKDRGNRRFHLDDELLGKAEIDIRGDLLDCHIDICTPDVLGLWTDNFDYKSLRSSFLRGVLQDHELNGKTIHTHIIKKGYIARVSSLRTYDAVTQDIIDRWTYPFTPDCNILYGHDYVLGKNKVYTESGVILARDSSINSRSIVGKDTSLGVGSVISNSVLGRRCQIGKNVRVEGCYIWDDVVIGDNSVITAAVIANEVVVGPNCTVGKGSLLSYRVQIAKGMNLPPKTRLMDEQDKSSTAKPIPSDISLVGKGGAGYAYEPDSDASDISDTLVASRSRRLSNESFDSISTLHSDVESDVDLQNGNSPSIPTSPVDGLHGGRIFFNEAINSIQDGILKGDDPDTVKLELLGQRLTHNASDTDMRDAIARALIRCVFTFIKPSQTNPSTSSESLLSTSPSAPFHAPGSYFAPMVALSPQEATSKVYTTYSPVLVQLGLFDSELPEKSDQVAVLRAIERECANHPKDGQKVLLFALNELHRNLKVLQDQGVLQWWDGGVDGEAEGVSEDGDTGTEVRIIPRGMEVRRLASTYVDYLLESDEETDSEEEDEEDNEDDDEEEEEE